MKKIHSQFSNISNRTNLLNMITASVWDLSKVHNSRSNCPNHMTGGDVYQNWEWSLLKLGVALPITY